MNKDKLQNIKSDYQEIVKYGAEKDIKVRDMLEILEAILED